MSTVIEAQSVFPGYKYLGEQVFISSTSQVAQLVGTGLIPSQGTHLGCRFNPGSGHVQETTHWCFSLSLPLSLPLKIFQLKHILG